MQNNPFYPSLTIYANTYKYKIKYKKKYDTLTGVAAHTTTASPVDLEWKIDGKAGKERVERGHRAAASIIHSSSLFICLHLDLKLVHGFWSEKFIQ